MTSFLLITNTSPKTFKYLINFPSIIWHINSSSEVFCLLTSFPWSVPLSFLVFHPSFVGYIYFRLGCYLPTETSSSLTLSVCVSSLPLHLSSISSHIICRQFIFLFRIVPNIALSSILFFTLTHFSVVFSANIDH